MNPNDWLLSAAKRCVKLLEAQARGSYYPANEEIYAGRDLVEAIAAVEAEQEQQRLEAAYQDVRR